MTLAILASGCVWNDSSGYPPPGRPISDSQYAGAYDDHLDEPFELPPMPDPPPPLPPLPDIRLPSEYGVTPPDPAVQSGSGNSSRIPDPPRPVQFAGPFRHTGKVRAHIFGKPNVQGNLFRGERRNSAGRVYYHQGVDVLAPLGTQIIAPADGVIEKAGAWDPRGYGRAVLVRVDTTERTLFVLYAHLNTVTVRQGQRVRRGEAIGTVGNSGNAGSLPRAEMHLHLEVRDREPAGSGLTGRLDPLSFFPGIRMP